MIFRHELVRLFGLWIKDLENNNDWLQVSIVTAVMNAFLIWYDS